MWFMTKMAFIFLKNVSHFLEKWRDFSKDATVKAIENEASDRHSREALLIGLR